MVTSARSQVVATDREKWDKIFGGLVKLLKNQQEQLENLGKERKILEDRIKLQHERWASDIRDYEDHIFQMNGEMVEKDMACLLEAAKGNLMLGLKQREASIHKLKLEQTEDELADFQTWFEKLSQNLKVNSGEIANRKGGRHCDLKSGSSKTLEAEVKRLKLENKKLVSEKSFEVSALLKEKDFVWNQYKILESNLTDRLRSKEAEAEGANEKTVEFLATVELLQSSNDEKDKIISKLNNKVAELEADTKKWKEQTSNLSQQLELLRKSRSALVTPVMKYCSTKARSSSMGVRSRDRDTSDIIERKVLKPAQSAIPSKDSKKGSRSLKKKRADCLSNSEPPKLFSCTFKVPKLKVPATPVR